MRILHTADWHLGRTLHGHARRKDHEAFLDRLVALAAEVDVVLVAGDVFESANPPIDAEQLLFDALARLGDGGRRAVVVIAGNHDSPDRLRACAPLATRHGVWVLGRPHEVPRDRRGLPGVAVNDRGPGWLDVTLPEAGRAVIGALPYPSEARLGQVLSPALGEREVQAAYEARVAAIFAELASHFRPDAVNLLTSHLAVTECLPGGSERALVGGAWQVSARVFPEAADYVALGHLHLAQAAPAAGLVRYSGAPLPFRFDERDHPREVVIVDAAPGRAPAVERVPLGVGRPLVVWEAHGVEAVVAGVAEGLHADAFVDLALHVPTRLTPTELARLQRLPRDFVRIRAVLPASEAAGVPPSERRELPLDALFRAFYADQTGHDPEPELTRLFVSLAEG